MPEETASFEVKFTPREIGKYEGQVRLFTADNPYENLMIDLKGEAYAEVIVLEGLELINIKYNFVENERRENNSKLRKSSSVPNSAARGIKKNRWKQLGKILQLFQLILTVTATNLMEFHGISGLFRAHRFFLNSLPSIIQTTLFIAHFSPNANDRRFTVSSTSFPVSLTYKLDFGNRFVNKIYKKNFRIVSKSANQHLRFRWSANPNVVFTPSIGHLKPLACKEIVATFLPSEPANYVDVIKLISSNILRTTHVTADSFNIFEFL